MMSLEDGVLFAPTVLVEVSVFACAVDIVQEKICETEARDGLYGRLRRRTALVAEIEVKFPTIVVAVDAKTS